MFLLVKDPLPVKEIDDSELVIRLDEDGKNFTIIKHPNSEFRYKKYHMSMLKHFILSVEQKNEETN